MFTHLQRRQPQVYQELDKGKAKVTTAIVQSTGSGDVIPKGQLRLQDVIKSQYILKSSRALDCSKSIGIFMTKDLRPYSVVDNAGFRYMVNTLEPRYTIPSRTHFSESVVSKLYEEVKSEVVNEIKKCLSCCSNNRWIDGPQGRHKVMKQ